MAIDTERNRLDIINKELEQTLNLLKTEFVSLQNQNNVDHFQSFRNKKSFEQELSELNEISSLHTALIAKEQDIEDLIEISLAFQEKLKENESIQNFNTQTEKMKIDKFLFQM